MYNAVYYDRFENVKALLDKDVNSFFSNNENSTPILEAVKQCHYDSLFVLLDHCRKSQMLNKSKRQTHPNLLQLVFKVFDSIGVFKSDAVEKPQLNPCLEVCLRTAIAKKSMPLIVLLIAAHITPDFTHTVSFIKNLCFGFEEMCDDLKNQPWHAFLDCKILARIL